MKVTTNGPYRTELVSWLEQNVGRVLHSKPIINWVGDGWTLTWSLPASGSGYQYVADIDDPDLSLLFALRWA